MKNIIVFPGSFDPVHNGHLLMAEKASVLLNADVIFVPAVISVWKDESAPFIDKVNMLKLSTRNYPRFFVSDYEGTTGKSINYSIETMKHFKEVYKDDNLYLLIGEDQVNQFHKWKDADELAKIARIIFFERPEIEMDKENVNRFNMLEIEGIPYDASSSEIRTLTNLRTPIEVIDYIAHQNLYYMKKISSILSKDRLNHSLEVAKLARLIAFSNEIDISSAYIAGLLHDVGKDIEKEEQNKIMLINYPEYMDLPKFSYHQFVGEHIAKEIFNVKDEEVLDAIKFHATGKVNMSPLGKIIYASDKIEPTRGFDSSDLIKGCLHNYEKGFVDVLDANRIYLLENKKDIENRLTKSCFDQYLDL